MLARMNWGSIFPAWGKRVTSGGGGELNTGGNVSLMEQSALPVHCTESTVLTAAERAGHLESQAYIAQEASNYLVRQGNAALKNIEIQANHSVQMQKIQAQYERILGKHAVNKSRSTLSMEANRTYVSAYQSNFSKAKSTLNF